jgi:hypothetical protein
MNGSKFIDIILMAFLNAENAEFINKIFTNKIIKNGSNS